MWLINSSIGRKVVMSLTGIALVLFMLLLRQLHWEHWPCVTLFMHLSSPLKTEEHEVQSVMQ